MMASHFVVLDKWPPPDIPAAAAAWASSLGGATMDHTRQLRTCRGIAAQRLEEPEAQKLATALTAAGATAWAISGLMVPQLPKPLTASRVDPHHDDALHVQVALTGPPEKIDWRRIVLTLPACRLETKQVAAKQKKTKVSAATVVMAVTTGIGAIKVIKAIRNKPGKGAKGEIEESSRALLEIVSVGPLKRFHAYADRLDYGVLGADRVQGKDNFRKLLALIRDRTRAELASRPVLDRFIETGQLPRFLHIEDNNELAAIARWLLLRGAAKRMSARAQKS